MNEQGDQRGDAFLRSGLPAEGPAPAWLDAIIAGRLIAGFIEPVGALRRDAAFVECEEVAPGRWAVARAIESDDDVRAFVAAVRRAAVGGRAGIAVSSGALGAAGPLGDAPHDALRLCEALVGRRGLLVDPIVHAAVGGPASVVADGRLLTAPRRTRPGRWIAGIAAAAVLLVAGLQLLKPSPPPGQIYIFGQPQAIERSAGEAGNFARVQVNISGAPGQYASLIVRDAQGQLALPNSKAINRELTEKQRDVRSVFNSDGQPGKTWFMAVFSKAPLPDLEARVAALNASGGDVDALRERLGDAHLVVAEPLEHTP